MKGDRHTSEHVRSSAPFTSRGHEGFCTYNKFHVDVSRGLICSTVKDVYDGLYVQVLKIFISVKDSKSYRKLGVKDYPRRSGDDLALGMARGSTYN